MPCTSTPSAPRSAVLDRHDRLLHDRRDLFEETRTRLSSRRRIATRAAAPRRSGPSRRPSDVAVGARRIECRELVRIVMTRPQLNASASASSARISTVSRSSVFGRAWRRRRPSSKPENAVERRGGGGEGRGGGGYRLGHCRPSRATREARRRSARPLPPEVLDGREPSASGSARRELRERRIVEHDVCGHRVRARLGVRQDAAPPRASHRLEPLSVPERRQGSVDVRVEHDEAVGRGVPD